MWAVDSPAVEVAGVYARRLRLLERRGIAHIAFAEAVRTLTERCHEVVRIGAVEVADPPYHFQLFLSQTATEVIACLGVAQAGKQKDPAKTPP